MLDSYLYNLSILELDLETKKMDEVVETEREYQRLGRDGQPQARFMYVRKDQNSKVSTISNVALSSSLNKSKNIHFD